MKTRIRLLGAALAVVTFPRVASAEIKVNESGGDLTITRTLDAADAPQLNVNIFRKGDKIRVSGFGHTLVEGAQWREYEFPEDDIVVELTNPAAGLQNVFVRDIEAYQDTNGMDDLRINTTGQVWLDDVFMLGTSHSRIEITAPTISATFSGTQTADLTGSTVDLDRVFLESLDIRGTGGNDHVILTDCWVGGETFISLKDSTDSLWLERHHGDELNAYLGRGPDYVTVINGAGGFDVNQSWFDGDSGSDGVYQDDASINVANSTSFEFFKAVP